VQCVCTDFFFCTDTAKHTPQGCHVCNVFVCACVRARVHINIHATPHTYIQPQHTPHVCNTHPTCATYTPRVQCVCVRVCACVCVHINIHATPHAYIQPYIHTCIHTCLHTCMHTYRTSQSARNMQRPTLAVFEGLRPATQRTELVLHRRWAPGAILTACQMLAEPQNGSQARDIDTHLQRPCMYRGSP
jgi:hypothetical protein